MKKIKLLIVMLIVITNGMSIHADIVTKILQNGLDGYSRCEDTYIEVIKGFTGDTADYAMWHDNFSEEKFLNIAN